MSDTTVHFQRRLFVNFNDSSYRWICVKIFQFAPLEASDEQILLALVRDWHYRDSYISAESHEEDSKTTHGPYLVSRIGISAFLPIGQVGANGVLAGFCGLNGFNPTPETQACITACLAPILNSTAAFYRLAELPDARHETSFVLWEFRELLAINRLDGSVALVVMAVD